MWPPPDRRKEAWWWKSDRKVVYIFREKGYNKEKVRVQEGRKEAYKMGKKELDFTVFLIHMLAEA